MTKISKKPWKSLGVALTILLSSLSLSCQRVRIKDGEHCADVGPLGAVCFMTLSDKTRDIPKEQWGEERFGQICSSPAVFADWKAAILKLCKISKSCTYDEIKDIQKFGENVEKVRAIG